MLMVESFDNFFYQCRLRNFPVEIDKKKKQS